MEIKLLLDLAWCLETLKGIKSAVLKRTSVHCCTVHYIKILAPMEIWILAEIQTTALTRTWLRCLSFELCGQDGKDCTGRVIKVSK